MRGHVAKKQLANSVAWYVVVDVGADGNGKRRQKWHGKYATEREAERALPGLVGSLHDSSYIEPTKATVSEYLTGQWLPAVRLTLRPSTADNYEALIRSRIVPHIGKRRLQALNAADLNAMYAALLASGRTGPKKDAPGLSAKSVHNTHAIIRHALADALRWGLVSRNVALMADPPKVKTAGATMKTWSAPELKKFLAFTADDRLGALWTLLATTGLRRGEALALKWDAVDLKAKRLAVRATLSVSGYTVRVEEPKTDRGRRNVALDAKTVAVLKAERRRQLEDRMAAGPAWSETGYVFTREDGAALHPDGVSQAFERAVKASGLPRVRLHDLRHTHASLSLQAGIPAKVVSERLGHSSISITLDVYSHVAPGMQEDAADLVANLVFGD